MRIQFQTINDTHDQHHDAHESVEAERQEIQPTRNANSRVLVVPIGDIAESPDNTRLFDKRNKDEKVALEELAASIRALGLQQFPKVRAHDGATPWVLVYGARRLRACRDILTWREITVLVDEDMSRESAAEITVVENLQRRDLHPMDEARGIAILRSQGKTVKEIAARLGRREEWIKERLKLCDLPAKVQDIYRRSERMTLHQALELHDYTHGGKDNAGFLDLMIALAERIDAGSNPMGGLSSIPHVHPHLVVTIQHAYSDGNGRWGGNYFDTKKVCTRCPFAAYRPSYYEGGGYCLLPTHYQELQRKGKEKFDAARADEDRKRREDPAYVPVVSTSYEQPATTKTPAQKGKETRQRHQKQKADYAPQVAAIERAVDMIPAVDGIDVAVLAAYTLTTHNVDSEAVEQVVQRHGLKAFPGVEPTPTRQRIEKLRKIEPLHLVRYTLEAILLTHARRARDYDPGKSRADDVLLLYLPGQAASVAEEAA